MDFIIITSIFEPTEAVKKFAEIQPNRVVVVGDKKSPENWVCEGAVFLSVKDQMELYSEFANSLPFNHYCRKMLGYVYAIQSGATGIVDTDDDNIPLSNWGFPKQIDQAQSINESGFVNIYKLFTNHRIWPRGLPLKEILNLEPLPTSTISRPTVGVWQGLADEDPDVDAIYRLVSDEHVAFSKRPPVILEKNCVTPFNSQNTWIDQTFFPLLYLPTTVTFRYTDILRGIIAQPVLWSEDAHLGFLESTVRQLRNPHDYIKDFESEIPMYLTIEKALDIAISRSKKGQTIKDNVYNIYDGLAENEIVQAKELKLIELFFSHI
ncbi:STELLO glycosyltransferase family protein [Marinoscillum sp. MHG1-6]|uniref:STELLO glycosyltransferase family protein n=1 Tax=Marinoscillum sp. MHG1-6 TaxID=2959627 RepID=UPI0021578BB5|nr:STELLO glycosyltransferase family protein [Marinoscillum sp. MHG1-6]